jgi:hypothetical protein
MKKAGRIFLAALWGLSLVTYIAAKVGFFKRYGTSNYVHQHSKYWAAMVAIGIVAGL